ncbi:MAG TPA: PRC-barrel domain-containing protein, partial [Clostridia bacterium]|nr:PRC-barrel domain-containing protein [Clostridia bacterium]
MERYSEVLGLPVICVENGKKIGIIEDVIFCPKTKETRAFILQRKGCSIDRKVILVKDVLSLGNDALIVNDCTCAKNFKTVKNSEELKNRGDIQGLKIYSKNGENVGTVKDILFDYRTGTIEGVEISDGLIQDIVQGRRILPLF